jgi:hypothetical protein
MLANARWIPQAHVGCSAGWTNRAWQLFGCNQTLGVSQIWILGTPRLDRAAMGLEWLLHDSAVLHEASCGEVRGLRVSGARHGE